METSVLWRNGIRSKRVRLTLALTLAVMLIVSSMAGTVSAHAHESAQASVLDLPLVLDDLPDPVDPESWVFPDDMTWDDYRPVPGIDWRETNGEPETVLRGALVLGDFPDQPFIVALPEGSDLAGMPHTIGEIPRDQLCDFWVNYLNTPQEINGGRSLDEYWRENSYGKWGVELVCFGPYMMDFNEHQYGLSEWSATVACPEGAGHCSKRFQTEVISKATADINAWQAANGKTFDFRFALHAGYDESSVWQEFGEMKFQDRDSVSDAFGPPEGAWTNNWAPTRYVPWTSWWSAKSIWSSASGGTSQQAESSGQAVYNHEFGHIRGLPDNYNNPYGSPVSRSHTGPWDLMSRGSFNGPGGPHTRWMVPANLGGSVSPHFMLRNKLAMGFLSTGDDVISVTRNAVRDDGLIVTDVLARALPVGSEFGREGLRGIRIDLRGTTGGGGDLSPACSLNTDYRCDRGGYHFYDLEVVDRVGHDSFTPDHGVLISKSKTSGTPNIWIQDANPETLEVVDFVRPDGTEAMMSPGDYRQLSNVLFHAGAGGGAVSEFVDAPNKLHFYVLDKIRAADGALSYRVAVRHLDGAGNYERGVDAELEVAGDSVPGKVAVHWFNVTNTGEATDLMRITVSTDAEDWGLTLQHNVVEVPAGESVLVPVYVSVPGEPEAASYIFTATSETQPEASVSWEQDLLGGTSGLAVTLTSPEDGLYTNAYHLNVTGSVSNPEATVAINGEEIEVEEDGSFSEPYFLSDHDGPDVITVTATLDGETVSVARTVNVKRTAPVLTNLQPAEDVKLAHGGTVTVSFDSEPGLEATYEIIAGGFGLASLAPGTPMEETSPGHYEAVYTAPTDATLNGAIVQFHAVDKAGNLTTESAAGTLTIAKGPTLTVTAPADGLRTALDVATVTGSVSDDDGVTSLTVNGRRVNAGADGSFSTRIVLNEGDNTVTVTATNSLGIQTTVTRTVKAIWSPPSLNELEPSEDVTLLSGETATLRFTAAPGLTAAYQIVFGGTPGTVTGKGTAKGTPMTEVSPGIYEATYTAPANTTFSNATVRFNVADDLNNLVMITAPGRISVLAMWAIQ